MNGKCKKKISRAVSSALVAAMTLSLVAVADIADDNNAAYAAEMSDEMGSGSYIAGLVSNNPTLTIGDTYLLGGYDWIAAEEVTDNDGNKYVVMQSKGGVTAGPWPGYTILGNGNWYMSNIDGQDISTYDTKMTDLYDDLRSAEYTNASYGQGLYLISQDKARDTTGTTNNYNIALKTAAANYSSFGASNHYAWLGTYVGSGSAYYVNSSGGVNSNSQSCSYVVAPAFNLNTSLVNLGDYNTLSVAPFKPSTGIQATQSITSVNEGDTVNLSQVITDVTYVGGDYNGKPATYKISADKGTINGTEWTAPSGIEADETVTFTITETASGNNWSTSATLTVKNTGWIDTDGKADENGFYTWKDDATGITWHYKSNNDGCISCLYTEDIDISGIIDPNSNVLTVPSTINGIPVGGIGGGTVKNGKTIPFVPSKRDGSANTNDKLNKWTDIYIPKSVKTINNGAFEENDATASIVIPGTVSAIGAKAFYKSSITSVVFDSDEFNSDNPVTYGMDVYSYAFADIASLEKVAIRRSGVTLGYKSFANDTGLTSIDIPSGTDFFSGVKSDNLTDDARNSSYAFDNAENLKVIEIDAENVRGNIFSNTKNLEKVVFGEHVNYVEAEWAGTANSNASAGRTTYVLNADTIFKMNKRTDQGSAFGSTGELIVFGKSNPSQTDIYTDTGTQSWAKAGYLYGLGNGSPVMEYAQGTAGSIKINISDDPTAESGFTDVVPETPTGIEAHYKGSILAGQTLDKNKMTVDKIFGATKNGTYASSEYYVLTTPNANALINKYKKVTDIVKNNEGEFIAKDSETIKNDFAKHEKDLLEEKNNPGILAVEAVVLLKDADGNLLVDKEVNGSIQPLFCPLTIPVKNDTIDVGSYSEAIDQIKALQDQIKQIEADTEADAAEKDNEIKELTQKLKDVLNEYSKLLGSTNTGDNDYTYSVTDPATGTTTDYVIVNGGEATYDSSAPIEVTLPDGTKVPAYEATGKDENGNETKFWFYVGPDGVHKIEFDPANNVVTKDDVASTESDKLSVVQAKLTAQLAEIKTKLESISKKINEVKDNIDSKYLNYTDDEWNAMSDEEKMDAIAKAVEAMKKDYDTVNGQLTAAEDTTEKLNEVLMVLNKIGAGNTVTQDELALVAGLSKYPNLDELVKKGTGSGTDTETSTADLDKLAAIIQEGCKDNPSTAENEYGIYSDATLDAVGQYSKVIASVLEGLSDEISALRNTVATQLSTIETQKQTIADKQAQIDALQSGNVNEAYANAQKEIAALNIKLNDLTVEVEDLSKQILNMQSELNTLKTLIASIRSLLGIDADDDIIAAIKGLQDTIKDNATTIENLKKELADAKENGGDATKAYTEGYNTGFVDGFQNASKNAGNAENTANNDNIDELKNQNQTLVNEIATLKDKVTDYNNALKQNADLSAKLTEKNNTLAEKNTSLVEQNNELTEKNNQLTEQIGNLSSAVENQNQAIAGLKNQVANTPQTQIQTDTGLTSEVRNLASEVSSQNQAISGLKSQVASAGKTSSASTQQRTQSSTTPVANTTPSTTATPATTTTPITLKGTSAEEDTESDEIVMEDTEEETEREDLSSASLDFNNIGNGLSTEESSTEEFTEDDDNEEKGGSPLGAIIVVLVVLAAAGGAVFLFVIKPKLDAQAEEYEDDDDDDDSEDDDLV